MTQSHSLALIEYAGTSVLGVLDVSNPTYPTLLCWIRYADGGAFVQSPNQVLFWSGAALESIDLSSLKVSQTGRLAATPIELAYSPDGTVVAYRSTDGAGAITTHLESGGVDHVLYVQQPIGGHGGAPGGPTDQLEFSADGALLLDYSTFRPQSGPQQMLVFDVRQVLASQPGAAATPVFQSASSQGGVWSLSGGTLYFYAMPAGSTQGLEYLVQPGQGQPQPLSGALSVVS